MTFRLERFRGCQIGRWERSLAAAAIRWLERVAVDGCPDALVVVGEAYEHGWGVAPSPKRATGWYRRAATQHHAGGMLSLARSYEHGRGVERSATEAARLYLSAARLGHAEAQLHAGHCYATGRGVEADVSEAIRWYAESAEQGNPLAAAALERLSVRVRLAAGGSASARTYHGRFESSRTRGCVRSPAKTT